MAKTNPLNWNVRVVNPDGTPTKEFMAKWALQARINGGIPSLGLPAEVSAVLDVLSGTPNDILVRGASLWEGHPMSFGLDKVSSSRGDLLARKSGAWGSIGSPSDTTKFLNGALDPVWASVHDSDLSFSDITTNNVSVTAHGFAPKLPNDATKYMDGTGAYTVPPGTGSGGGAYSVLATGTVSAAASLDLDLSTYTASKILEIELIDIIPVTNNTTLQARVGKGSPIVYQSGASDYHWASLRTFSSPSSGADGGVNTQVSLNAGNGEGNQSYSGWSGSLKTHNWTVAAAKNRWMWDGTHYTDNDLTSRTLGGWRLNQAVAITGIQFFFASGNIASGAYRILGLA